MSHYFNPPKEIEFCAREIKAYGTFEKLTAQLKPGEHLFALAYRGRSQCIYLHNEEIYKEYCEVIHHYGHFNGFYAMGSKAWDKYFGHVPLPRYKQHGIPENQEQMIPIEDLFFDED